VKHPNDGVVWVLTEEAGNIEYVHARAKCLVGEIYRGRTDKGVKGPVTTYDCGGRTE